MQKKLKNFKKVLAKLNFIYYNLIEVERSGTKWWKKEEGEPNVNW